jgi:hypothetical protein
MALQILLIQLYSNGDCLYATAVARQLKLDYPGCRLTWAVSSFCKDIIANNPYVDDVLVVDTVVKNDITAYRKFKHQIRKQQKAGVWHKVIITNVIDEKQANYDGSIRSAVLRGYDKPVTVPLQPVLRLYDTEIEKANAFAKQHELHKYRHVILFEFAPQSAQSQMTPSLALELSGLIVQQPDTAIVLSSAQKTDHPHPQIIDGSCLTLRETAALTHHCTLLMGSSSGITWVSTSDAAKPLPMIQLMDPYTPWVNAVSRDFERFNFTTCHLIELFSFDNKLIRDCVQQALTNFAEARKKYHQLLPLHFKATRSIVYNLLCFFHFGAIVRHIRINKEVHGNNPAFYRELFMGILTFPFRLTGNLVRKHILKKR